MSSELTQHFGYLRACRVENMRHGDVVVSHSTATRHSQGAEVMPSIHIRPRPAEHKQQTLIQLLRAPDLAWTSLLLGSKPLSDGIFSAR